ncbi:histidine kinase [Actinomadura keratinilytica]
MLAATRPVAAWWLTMPVGAFASVLTGYGDTLPFGPVSFLVTLIVSTIAAAWQGPRAALWMWLITAAFSLFVGGMTGVGSGSTVPLLFFLGLALTAVSIWHFRRTTRETVREAHREVSAERSATAAERTRAVRLEERTTIARELHDVVAHHMSVVAIQAEAAPTGWRTRRRNWPTPSPRSGRARWRPSPSCAGSSAWSAPTTTRPPTRPSPSWPTWTGCWTGSGRRAYRWRSW